MIFISHSSKNINIVEPLVDFLKALGIKSDQIFCSSIEGNGVKNGLRIPDECKKQIQAANLVVYLITNDFLKSDFCIQELGAMWLSADKNKRFFIFKFNDVTSDEIRGFIDSSYKYNDFNEDGLYSFYERMQESYNIDNKPTMIHNAIKSLLKNTGIIQSNLVETKAKTRKELENEEIKDFKSNYEDLSFKEKLYIAIVFYNGEGVEYFPITDGTAGLLHQKGILFYTSNYATMKGLSHCLPMALAPLYIRMIKSNKTIQNELKTIHEKYKSSSRSSRFY